MSGAKKSFYRQRKFWLGCAAFLAALCVLLLVLNPLLNHKHIASVSLPGEMKNAGLVSGRASPGNLIPPAGFEKLAEAPATALYADLQTGQFIYEDKIGGKFWHSKPVGLDSDEVTIGLWKEQMGSMLLLEYVDMKSVTTSIMPLTLASSACVEADGATFRKIDGGFRAEYHFEEADIFIPMEITLKNGVLSAVIQSGEIKEGGDYHIAAIHVLPGLTATDSTETGYMLVPDGSGAISELNNGKGNFGFYDRPVYGLDESISPEKKLHNQRPAIFPVFGVKTGDHALTAIITQGEAEANIYVGNVKDGMNYNQVYAKIVTAQTDSTTLFEADYFNKRKIYNVERRTLRNRYEVQYFPLSGENASYTGMAKLYREYLKMNGQLTKKAREPALHIGFYGAAERQAWFLGIPYDKLFALTTYAQAKEILDELTGLGANRIAVRYEGWTNYGLQNEKITVAAKPIGVLGGVSGFRWLSAYYGKSLSLGVDFITMKKSGRSYSVMTDTVKTMFNTRVKKYDYILSAQVTNLNRDFWYLIKPFRLPALAKTFADSFHKEAGDAGGVYLTGIGRFVYSDFDKTGITRSQTVEYYRKAMSALGDIPLSVDTGNAYTLGYADRIYELPCTDSGFTVFDRSVPFAQIVLHGYIPYSSDDFNRATDRRKLFLYCMETGASPFYAGMYARPEILIETDFSHLYSTYYKDWTKDAAQNYQAFAAVYENLFDKEITAHDRLAPSVYRTTFSNGTKIYVNYSGTRVLVDGMAIKAMDYEVKEAAN